MDKKIVAILAVVVIIAVVACAYVNFAQDDDVVSVGYLLADYNPALVVSNLTGMLDNQTVKTKIISYNNGREIMTALASGEIDVAYVDLEYALSYIEKGSPIKIISAAQSGGSGVIVSNKSNISSPSDFVGKNVATPHDDSIQYLLFENYLKKNGISIDDVNVSSVSCAYMNESIKKGKIDAAVTYEPYVSINEINGSKILLNSDELMPNHPNVVIVASDDFLSKHPGDAQKFLKIHETTTNKINNNSSLVAGMLLIDSITNQSLKEQYLNKVSILSGLPDDFKQNVSSFMNIEVDLGYLKKPLSEDELFWNAS